MNLRIFFALVLLGSFALLQGCGDNGTTEKLSAQLQAARSELEQVKAELDKAMEKSAQDEEIRRALTADLETARQRLAEAEVRAEKAEAALRAARKQAVASARRSGPPDATRIKLMGAKALAEYRAKKLGERLDILKKDLEGKERELQRIREEARAKDREVAALRKRVEEFQTAQKGRADELSAKLKALSREIAKRSEESKRLKQELDDKVGLLQALKNAVTDAGRLKEEAEAKVAQLQAKLAELEKKCSARLAEVRKQVEAARNEQQAAQQEVERLKQVAEQARRDLEAINMEVSRLRKDRDHYHSEAAKARLELESREAEARDLRDKMASIRSELDSCRNKGQAMTETEPSTIDKLLQKGTPGQGTPTSRMTDLY